jgi:hypothetical protein
VLRACCRRWFVACAVSAIPDRWLQLRPRERELPTADVVGAGIRLPPRRRLIRERALPRFHLPRSRHRRPFAVRPVLTAQPNIHAEDRRPDRCRAQTAARVAPVRSRCRWPRQIAPATRPATGTHSTA